MNCQFCSQHFTSRSNLLRHQQTTKNFLKIQKDQNNPNIKIKTFKCKFCPKEVKSQQSLDYHLNICKSKPKNEYKKCKDDEIFTIIIEEDDDIDSIDDFNELKNITKKLQTVNKQLQDKLKKAEDDLKSKNSNIVVNNIVNNNTTINNITINMNFLDFMTAENIKQIFDKYYNPQTFLGAEKSLALFMVEKFLLGKDKPTYLCPDKSRYNFTYFNNDEIMDDLNAKILITLSKIYGADAIYNAYIENKKNIENVENIDEIYNKLKNLDHNNKDYLNELRILLPKNLKDREIQNKIYEIKLEDEEKTRIIKQDEEKKQKIEKQLLDNINLSDYENIQGVRKSLLEEFIKLYLRTGELKCPKNFSKKDIITFKKHIAKWSKPQSIELM